VKQSRGASASFVCTEKIRLPAMSAVHLANDENAWSCAAGASLVASCDIARMQSNEPANAAPPQTFAEPTPLGLLGLAIGCAALMPIALGMTLTPSALRTAAWFCLLFGGGGQLLAGVMALANKNLLGGTLFTTFSFNWFMNYWALTELSQGKLPDASVVLSVDVCFLVIFVVLTYAFGFFSKLLLVFLVDIDLLYALRIARELTHVASLGLAIAACTAALALIALWIAFALLVNPTAGREVFKMPGPAFAPRNAKSA
jgi:succinate-acetate transporter protein